MTIEYPENFTREELACKCGCGQSIEDELFLYHLQRLREMFGEPMIVSSGFRCPQHNNNISSTGLTGPHTKAAVDIKVSGPEAFRLMWLAISCGFEGIGINQKGEIHQRFIHFDRLKNNRPRVWSY